MEASIIVLLNISSPIIIIVVAIVVTQYHPLPIINKIYIACTGKLLWKQLFTSHLSRSKRVKMLI